MRAKTALIFLNFGAAFVIVAWGVYAFISPRIAIVLYKADYHSRMFECDHVMREHFIAKQLVLAKTDETTVRNLEAAEVGLTACHAYDKLRKKLLIWGLSEEQLAAIGLEAIEKHATDVRKFVEIHEIRY